MLIYSMKFKELGTRRERELFINPYTEPYIKNKPSKISQKKGTP